jgi:hypothetical protein
VYIIEDNAGAHTKAKRFAADRRIAKGFDIVDWPPRSPDLNKIERIWDFSKDYVEQIRLQSSRPSLSRAQIKLQAQQAWETIPQRKIDAECRDFRRKLIQCRDNNGDNNFYG